LYYDYQSGFNIKSIRTEAMPYSLLEKNLRFLYNNRNEFIETDFDDTLGDNE